MLSIPSVVSPASLALASDVGFNGTYPDAIKAWKDYAASKYPEEAVGFLLTGGEFLPVDNVHEEPENFFAVDDAVYVAYADALIAVLHSHTNGAGENDEPSIEPSKADMERQILSDVPWGVSTCHGGVTSNPIWWGDSLEVRPLVGRQFVHGITDCYSLVRDWHRLNGIMFDDVPRDPDWWLQDDENLYMELFESRGFRVVTDRAPIEGDCFMCKLMSTKRNHAGVFVSNQVFLHHPGGSLSLRSQAARWRQKLDMIVRHKDLPEEK